MVGGMDGLMPPLGIVMPCVHVARSSVPEASDKMRLYWLMSIGPYSTPSKSTRPERAG